MNKDKAINVGGKKIVFNTNNILNEVFKKHIKDLQKNQMIDKIQDIFCDNSMYPYTELLYKMTEPLSNNRITPIMALSELKEILNYNPSYEKQSKKTIKKKSR